MERITYSSRPVHSMKLHLSIKDILKFMLAHILICFVTYFVKIIMFKKVFRFQSLLFRLKYLPALKTGPVFLIPLNRNVFLQIPYKTMWKYSQFESECSLWISVLSMLLSNCQSPTSDQSPQCLTLIQSGRGLERAIMLLANATPIRELVNKAMTQWCSGYF